MSYISLKNAGVTFAIYNAKTRSIRNQLIKNIGGRINANEETILIRALDNINLEIRPGDRIGLIGHNGAGKTTLLKLLSGIYEPTEGTIISEGAISSLTDITMGMDPENTGYDNIIMRCIFMGMKFKEAKDKVDEIVEFSELSEYINLPTRTYSTGMYLRLAFAIATTVIPDILILDEMIGAGDTSFIEKAKERTFNLIKKTKIMILSSHDLQIMRDACNIGVWMEKGRIRMQGPIDEVINEYKSAQGNLKVAL